MRGACSSNPSQLELVLAKNLDSGQITETNQDLNLRSARFLEWDRLLAYLSLEARSNLAKELCLVLDRHLGNTCDIEQAKLLLDETEEAVSMLESNSALLADVIPDLRTTLSAIKSGGMLQPLELYAIARLLGIAKNSKESLSLLSRESFPRLYAHGPRLTVLEDLRREISRCIDEGGNIADDASSHLRQIRNSIRKLHARIKDELQSLIHSSKVSKVLQEPIYTVRNGRYVLPVNANWRNSGTVNGIVHDSSQSGLTVYIEPVSVIEPTNQIRLNEAEEEREIARILDELGNKCRSHIEEIDTNYSALTELDIIMAKARLALKYGGNKPDVSEIEHKNTASLHLIKSAHPLLVLHGVKNVIANDLLLKNEDRTLIITGPNTGGKTVLLKQIGLTCLMVKCGLLPSAQKGSVIPIFGKIWADIGDEQSLEANLSTFSSHMKNIVGIVEGAGSGTLVLLDEIGVGTDPREGEALAQSVLECLNESGAITVSTTHYGELKALGYTKPGFVNGSLEFDEAGITPTYKLQVGIPGSSKGTVIASRLGLKKSVVERADQILFQSKDKSSDLMSEMETKLREILAHEKWLSASKESLEQEAQSLDAQKQEMLLERKETLEKMTGDFFQEVKEAQDRVRQIIRELQSQPSLAKAQKVQDEIDRLKKEQNWPELKQINIQKGTANNSILSFEPGQYVELKSLGQNQIGIIDSIEGNHAFIILGRVRTKVALSELVQATSQSKKQAKKAKMLKPTEKRDNRNKPKLPSKEDVAGFVRTSINTLDLRGMRADDAQIELESFLDRVSLQNISPIMIIHGHGTGALKSLVRSFLSSATFIGAQRPGDFHEGGDGVTIASLA